MAKVRKEDKQLLQLLESVTDQVRKGELRLAGDSNKFSMSQNVFPIIGEKVTWKTTDEVHIVLDARFTRHYEPEDSDAQG